MFNIEEVILQTAYLFTGHGTFIFNKLALIADEGNHFDNDNKQSGTRH